MNDLLRIGMIMVDLLISDGTRILTFQECPDLLNKFDARVKCYKNDNIDEIDKLHKIKDKQL